MHFPEDENGDVLRRMHEAGMDLLQAHDIDFWHLFPTKADAEAMALRCRAIGIRVDDERCPSCDIAFVADGSQKWTLGAVGPAWTAPQKLVQPL